MSSQPRVISNEELREVTDKVLDELKRKLGWFEETRANFFSPPERTGASGFLASAEALADNMALKNVVDVLKKNMRAIKELEDEIGEMVASIDRIRIDRTNAAAINELVRRMQVLEERARRTLDEQISVLSTKIAGLKRDPKYGGRSHVASVLDSVLRGAREYVDGIKRDLAKVQSSRKLLSASVDYVKPDRGFFHRDTPEERLQDMAGVLGNAKRALERLKDSLQEYRLGFWQKVGLYISSWLFKNKVADAILDADETRFKSQKAIESILKRADDALGPNKSSQTEHTLSQLTGEATSAKEQVERNLAEKLDKINEAQREIEETPVEEGRKSSNFTH